MQHERYIRQTILKDFGVEAQEQLAQSRVLVVGAGGLGVPVLQYLNAMGVGKIGLIDNDVVSLSNLHRQVLYAENDVNISKVSVAIEKLGAQNSTTVLKGYNSFLTTDNALTIIKDYDVVVDASDNFSTRYLVNDACVMLEKPFIYGALHGFEGYVSVFNYNNGPTYRCLFPTIPKAEEIPNCNEQGVLGVIPGIIGNLQALETVKIITGIGTPLSGKLLIFNGLEQTYHKFNIITQPEHKTVKALQRSYELVCDLALSSIKAPTLNTLLESDDTLQLIDVRTHKEYEAFHLKQAIHMPLDTLEENQNSINFNKPVYLLCQSGVRSVKAIQILQKHQPKAALINIEGGLNELMHDVSGY